VVIAEEMVAPNLHKPGEEVPHSEIRRVTRDPPNAPVRALTILHGPKSSARNGRGDQRHSIWLFATASCVAATLIGILVWTSWTSRQVVITAAYDSSSGLALSVKQFVARTVETIDLGFRSVAEEIVARRIKTPHEMQSLLSELVKGSPQITSLALVGPDGHLRYTSVAPIASSSSVDVSDRPYFSLARRDDKIHIVLEEANPFRPGGKQILLSRRVNRGDGVFAGVVVAALNRDYVQQFLYVLNVAERGVIALDTDDGTVLAQWPHPEGTIGKDLSSSPIFKQWLPLASSAVIPLKDDDDGLWRIVAYQRVDQLPLVVHVALSQNVVLAAWRRTTIVQAAICVSMVLACWVMALRLNRELVARARAHSQLHETVRHLESARLTAEDSNRAKSEFLANMSHELRTPLNAIIGFSELIRDARMGPVSSRYQDYAQDIHGSGAHLLRLITEVLDLAKVESGRLELFEGSVTLERVIEDCTRIVADRAAAGGLALATDIPADLPTLRGDELRLKQILLNLLSNAIKFTPTGGRICLSAEVRPDHGIHLSVTDNGIGMDPDEIPLALEPFRQLEGSLNRRFEGTGLGLPLARRLTELHGGILDIISTKARGTIATVKLPASRVIFADPLGIPKAV
jgi:two-component system, cell cycle sensor histidine kinase PleC